MNKVRTFISVVALLASVGAIAPAAAEPNVPHREGNIWGWTDHEPVPSTVEHDEQAAGIAPSPERQRRANDTVEQLYQQLLQAQTQNVQ